MSAPSVISLSEIKSQMYHIINVLKLVEGMACDLQAEALEQDAEQIQSLLAVLVRYGEKAFADIDRLPDRLKI